MQTNLKIAIRQLWRRKLFSSLNIIGLSISISACWIIFSIVRFEYSFESGFPDRNNTYRLISGYLFDEKEHYIGAVSAPMYQAIREHVPGIKRVVPVYGRWIKSVEVPSSETRVSFKLDKPEHIVQTDASYFEMVPYTWLAGHPASAFSSPENVVLTEGRAKQYFGDAMPDSWLGRTLVYNDTIQKTVSGIVKELNYPTEFVAQEFFFLPPTVYAMNAWTNTNGSDKVFIQLSPHADTSTVLKRISIIAERKWEEFQQQTKSSISPNRWFEFISVADSHFATRLQDWDVRKASKTALYGLIGLGGFLLLLACINYINLTTAQIPERSKEIGIRKTLGSSRGRLFSEFLLETLLTVSIATLLAFLLSGFGFRYLAEFIPAGTTDSGSTLGLLGFLGLLVLFVSLLSNWYPAWLVGRLQPLHIIRNVANWNGKRKGISPRKVLIVLQFVIAQAFIVGALIMGAQLNYALKNDFGFKKDAVILVNIAWNLNSRDSLRMRQHTLANLLRLQPGIQAVSLGAQPLASGVSSSRYQYFPEGRTEPIRFQIMRKEVDTNYVHLYGLQLLAGRNLFDSDTTREFLINETAMRAFGFNSARQAIGQFIGQPGGMFPVVGVIKDFHLRDFHNAIEPLALMVNKENLSTLNIQLAGLDRRQWQQSIRNIEKAWNEFYPPGTFSYHFYDEAIELLYAEERKLSKLINLATGIAILISCLGLFGLASLTAFQKTKEIGIRKVLGASVSGIVRMLSYDFIRLVLIALVIASPIAWWIMHGWLQDFTYRIRIEWWMFGISGLAAVLIAMVTVSYQSIRAAIRNPVESLRTE